jgi:hypothetical protein
MSHLSSAAISTVDESAHSTVSKLMHGVNTAFEDPADTCLLTLAVLHIV